jgi:hypothetical protein
MNHSQAIGNSDIVIPNKAYSYQLTDGNHVKFDLGITTVGSSGVSTTIHDLGLWAKNYQKTVVGTTEIYDRMQKATYLNSGEKLHYGMGLQFGTYKGLDIVFHGGGDVGYRSYILHVPKHQLSIVMLANSNDFSSLDLVYKTVDILFDKELNTQAEEKTIASPGELKKLEGMYEIFPGTYYEILAEKGNLYFQQLGTTDKAPLPQLNENTFDFPYIPHSRLVFYPDKFDFHIADFAYPAYRKRMQIPNPKEMDLKAFAGIYRNKDHDITYELIVRNNLLIAKHKGNGEIILNALTKTSFYSTQSFFGQLDFFATSKGAKGFKLSGQNLKNIVFEKYH